MILLLFFLVAILPALNASSDPAHDIKILKLQIKTLIKLQTETNQKLILTNKRLTELGQETNRNLTKTNQVLSLKLTQASQELQKLQAKDQALNGYCKTKPNICGSCYCVEDFSIPDKYFCDCRGKPIRRDCKEHYVQGERTNGLYRINMNTYGMVVPVYCDQTTDGGW